MTTNKRIIRSGARRHPVTSGVTAHRAENLRVGVADAITEFTGSMPFVYLHALAFAL